MKLSLGGALLCAAVHLTACSSHEEASLISSELIEGDALPVPLTQSIGDGDEGRQVFQSREQGHCVLCHQIQNLNAEFQGNLGPDLTEVGSRLTPGQIRLRIIDYERVLSGVTMPSYYRIHDLNQVGDDYENQSVLTAQQVEDLVVFLSEQKGN